MKYLALIATYCLLMMPVQAEVITAEQDPWPPFIASDGSSGISVEIAAAAFLTQGMELKMKIAPWARAIDNVKKGKTDVLVATWHTQERTAFLRYSDEYMKNEIKFIKRAGDDFEYKDLESLSGKNVGIVRDYGYGDAFLSATNFTKNETKDLVGNLKKLEGKRIDLTLEDAVVAMAIMKEKGIDPSKFEFTSGALSTNALHVTSGVANPKSEAIVTAFNTGLKAIKENGTFASILEKYGIKE